jgi:large subunit ribosomal protein L21
MYAIVEVGGRQYRVSPGDQVLVEKLAQPEGSSVELPVLLLSNADGIAVGTPYVAGQTVTATIAGTVKGEKLIAFKYTPKKRYRVKTGHRQKYTVLRIAGEPEAAIAAVAVSEQPAEPVAAPEATPVVEPTPAA